MESSIFHGESFKCEVCLKSLSSKQNLKQHMNVHTGERPFRCTFPGCDCTYRHASQLSNHKSIHKTRNEDRKFEFTSFKDFIFLVIKALESASITQVPSEPYKRSDVILPQIKFCGQGAELPSLDSLEARRIRLN